MIFKNRKILLLSILLVVLGFIIYDSTSQPSVSDLKGNFKETATYRNENNTGPIIRIYAVSVEGLPLEEMKKYGDLMPYTKYGTTTVYFFDASKSSPTTVTPGASPFDATYNENCVGAYIKDQNGEVSFKKSPF